MNAHYLTCCGANLLSAPAISFFTAGPAPTIADSMLAALSDYGGRTFTMLPLPSSPAINEAISSTAITDQRGLPMNAVPDIGAVKNHVARVGFVDTDGDGMDDRLKPIHTFIVGVPDGGPDADRCGSTNRDEIGNNTGPRDSNALRKVFAFSRTGHMVNLSWASFPGTGYTLEYGDTLNFGSTVNFGTASGMSSSATIDPLHWFASLCLCSQRLTWN